MKHWIRIVCIGILLMIPFSTVGASEENAKIKNLEQAVEAAQALYLEAKLAEASEPTEELPQELSAPESEKEEGAIGEDTVGEGAEEASSGEELSSEKVPSDSPSAEIVPEPAPRDKYRIELNQVALEVALLVNDLDLARKKEIHLAKRQKDLEQKLSTAEAEFKMGKIKAELRDELLKESIQLDFELNLTKLQIENSIKSFNKLTGKGIAEDFQFRAAYLITDGGKLSLPASVDQQPNGEEIRKKYTEVLTAFGELGEGMAAYIKISEQALQIEQDFKMGKASGEQLAAAREERDRAWMETFTKKVSYSKELYSLDCLLEGYIAKDVKKVAQPIFR